MLTNNAHYKRREFRDSIEPLTAGGPANFRYFSTQHYFQCFPWSPVVAQNRPRRVLARWAPRSRGLLRGVEAAWSHARRQPRCGLFVAVLGQRARLFGGAGRDAVRPRRAADSAHGVRRRRRRRPAARAPDCAGSRCDSVIARLFEALSCVSSTQSVPR